MFSPAWLLALTSTILTKVPPSNTVPQTLEFQVTVGGFAFENGSSILWSNLHVGENQIPITVNSNKRVAVSFTFSSIPVEASILCPISRAYVEPSQTVSDFITLTLPETADTQGTLAIPMYVFAEEVS